jgi:hypothetical protein
MSNSFQCRLQQWKIDRRRFLYATGGLAGLVATSRLQALTQTVTVQYVSTPGAPISTRAAFTVRSGEPGSIEEQRASREGRAGGRVSRPLSALPVRNRIGST